VAVLGRNGAGKTTLLRTIVGELRPRQGQIAFEGRDDTRTPTEQRVRRGLGTSRRSMRCSAGCPCVRTLPSVRHAADPGAIDEVLTLFPKLGQRLNQRAGTLSGGERKMLAVGRALLTRPKLLLLDEPTEGVWVGVIEEIATRLADSRVASGSSSSSTTSSWPSASPTTPTCWTAAESRSRAIRDDQERP